MKFKKGAVLRLTVCRDRDSKGFVLAVGMMLSFGCQAPADTTAACEAAVDGGLIFTELMIDTRGDDAQGQFIELLNTTPSAVNLTGMRLGIGKQSIEKALQLQAGVVEPGQFFVVSRGSSEPGQWSNFHAGLALPSLPHQQGVVTLACGKMVVDRLLWSESGEPGRSWMRSKSGNADQPPRWCSTSLDTLFDGVNFGSPGQPNGVCPVSVEPGFCLESGRPRPIRPLLPGALLVTEVMAAPLADPRSPGEWMELLATTPLDLNGLVVSVNGNRQQIKAPECLAVAAQTSFTVGDIAANQALPGRLAVLKMTLSDSGAQGVLLSDGLTIDSFSFGKSKRGAALQMDSQLTERPERNDSSEAFCNAPRSFGEAGEKGSPGEPNPPCVGSDAGPAPTTSCLDGLSQAPRMVDGARPGDVAFSEVMADPASVADDLGEYVELEVFRAFDLNGLLIRNGSASVSPFNDTDCRRVEAGDLLVLARSRDAAQNGGLGAVAGTFSFSLPNSAPDQPRTLVLESDNATLDTLEYLSTGARAVTGVSWQRQPSESRTGDAGSTGWCFAPKSTRYGVSMSGDRGTPGTPNRCGD